MYTKKLKFNNDGKFRIMLVGDPHEKVRDTSPEDKAKIADYLALQEAAITKLQPDLVVFMGDNVSATDVESFKKVAERLTFFCGKNKVPFAIIFGNHDPECAVDLKDQIKVYQEQEYCMMLNSSAYSNDFYDYNLFIHSSDESKKLFNLWFMNSGSMAEDQNLSVYDFVKPEQIQWYENTVDKIKEENDSKVLPSLLFQHIPVCEEYALMKEVSALSLLGSGVQGLNKRKGKHYVFDKKHTDVDGYMGEAPCTPDYNSGQFISWKKKGDVLGAFFGHDHMNDFVGTVDGIKLGQCKTASFRVYGDGMMQGVRVIDLDEKDLTKFDTQMHYYRQLVGNECQSLKGKVKCLRDRQSIKLEAGMKVAGVLAALTAVGAGIYFLKKK